jgi:surface protein
METGAFTFTTTGRTTTDGGQTYSKTYSENFAGEKVSFTDQEENRETQEINVTRILPEASISYTPAGPTDGNVISTISFNRSGIIITNNSGNADHLFTRNGNFTYSYDNGRGTIGYTTANVEWINYRPTFRPFITTWRTTNNGETLEIPLYNGINYDFDIDWGDGTLESYMGSAFSTISHIYATAGDHQVSIRGIFPRIYMAQSTSYGQKLRSIDQWGDIQRSSMNYAFYYAQNLAILATDTPILSGVTNMSYMFYNATNLTGNLSEWDTSKVQNMQYLFCNASNFNSPLTNWKLNKLTYANYMFLYTNAFNQDLSSWDLSGATNLSYMFQSASAFNGSLSGWDTHTVTNMSYMFYGTTKFNQPLSHFDTSKVTNMDRMFQNATKFNQDIGNWDTSKVTNMSSLFYGATMFNQDLSTRSITGINSTSNLNNMLQNTALSTYNYNQLLSSWSAQSPISAVNF